jgi:hypothetical protein
MGLKGYRLWGMGQLDSTCRAPPRCSGTSWIWLRKQTLESRLWNYVSTFTGARVEALRPGALKLKLCVN